MFNLRGNIKIIYILLILFIVIPACKGQKEDAGQKPETYIKEKTRQILIEKFTKLSDPVNLIMFTKDEGCQYCFEVSNLLSEIESLSEKINLSVYDFIEDEHKVKKYKVDNVPSIIVEGKKDFGIKFYGSPMGHGFMPFIETIIDVSKNKTDLSPKTMDILEELKKNIHIQVFVTPS